MLPARSQPGELQTLKDFQSRSPLPYPLCALARAWLGPSAFIKGREPMRILVILAISTLLSGCSGDRIKNSLNAPQAQPQKGSPILDT